MAFQIITALLTLIYLGWNPNDTDEFDPNDWKRKWIIFFSWFGLILMSILSIMILPFFPASIFILPVFGIVITDCIINLMYLGKSFGDTSKPDPKDWKRQWIIIISWIVLVSGVLELIYRPPYSQYEIYKNSSGGVYKVKREYYYNIL